MTKTIAPMGKYRIQRLIEDDGDSYIGGAPTDKDSFDDAKQYADNEKLADAKAAQAEGGEELALADTICFAVYDDKGEQVYVTDFMLGLD